MLLLSLLPIRHWKVYTEGTYYNKPVGHAYLKPRGFSVIFGSACSCGIRFICIIYASAWEAEILNEISILYTWSCVPSLYYSYLLYNWHAWTLG